MWCTRKFITWNKQVQRGHISKRFKVRSTGSQSLFENRVAFVTPKLFHCPSGSYPKLLNYDHKPHMITTHLGDCAITRVYFWIKYMGYWRGHNCPLYFVSICPSMAYQLHLEVPHKNVAIQSISYNQESFYLMPETNSKQ